MPDDHNTIRRFTTATGEAYFWLDNVWRDALCAGLTDRTLDGGASGPVDEAGRPLAGTLETIRPALRVEWIAGPRAGEARLFPMAPEVGLVNIGEAWFTGWRLPKDPDVPWVAEVLEYGINEGPQIEGRRYIADTMDADAGEDGTPNLRFHIEFLPALCGAGTAATPPSPNTLTESPAMTHTVINSSWSAFTRAGRLDPEFWVNVSHHLSRLGISDDDRDGVARIVRLCEDLESFGKRLAAMHVLANTGDAEETRQADPTNVNVSVHVRVQRITEVTVPTGSNEDALLETAMVNGVWGCAIVKSQQHRRRWYLPTAMTVDPDAGTRTYTLATSGAPPLGLV